MFLSIIHHSIAHTKFTGTETFQRLSVAVATQPLFQPAPLQRCLRDRVVSSRQFEACDLRKEK